MVKKQEKKSHLLTIVIILIIVSAGGYFYVTEPSGKEKYKVRAAGGESGYRASFINLTGQAAKDKKIGLSDDYWEGGKFK
ncbi:hypothetical protein OAR97_01060 [Arcobacteraceae bacterium]|nr:hypothetical protein [Arcobacteraceae bacterium]